jgi:ribosomal peptide maturation radical SAM protein 1
MPFRSRPPAEIVAEFDTLASRHGVDGIEVVDNILDMAHFDTVLPRLAERPQRLRLFYETKANLKRRHVQQLVDAGVTWIQPGIESLSSEVLALMDKGSQAWVNIQLLKWCRELGVRLSWNVLFGFPGEKDEWYVEMATRLPLLTHLQPPQAVVQVRFDRYSPHHLRPEKYGLQLRPMPLYRYVYPLAPEALADLCYFFEDTQTVDHGRNVHLTEAVGRAGVEAVRRETVRWSQRFWSGAPPLLTVEEQGDALRLLDTRDCAVEQWTTLRGLERAVYLLGDEAPTPTRLPELLRAQHGLAPDAEELAATVERLLARKLMVAVDGRLVSLAVRGDVPGLPTRPETPGGFVDLVRAMREGRADPKLVWAIA